jgi:hypothetical protein
MRGAKVLRGLLSQTKHVNRTDTLKSKVISETLYSKFLLYCWTLLREHHHRGISHEVLELGASLISEI